MLITVSVEELQHAFYERETDRRDGNTLTVEAVGLMSKQDFAESSTRSLLKYLAK